MASGAAMDGVRGGRTVHPLRERAFRLWWTGATVSLMGDQFYLVALPWLVLQMTGSVLALGTIMMAAAVPRAVLMLMGGAVTDRVSPRRVMMHTAGVRSLAVAALAALVWAGVARTWHLYVLAFAFGAADAFALPAARAFLPSLVAPEQLPAANAASQTSAQLTTIVGPAPAGLAVKQFGLPAAFLIDAVSFLAILAALWTLPDPPRPASTARRASLWAAVGEGLRYVASDPALRALLALAAALNLCISGPVSIGVAALVKSRFDSPAAYGAIVSALAFGGLAGTLLGGAIRIRRRGWLMLIGGSVIGVAVGAVPVLRTLPLLLAGLAITGAAAGLVNIQLQSWFQVRVDRAMLGRVMSVTAFASFGLLPVSLAAAGVVAAWSVPLLFIGAGSLVVLTCVLAAGSRSVRAIE